MRHDFERFLAVIDEMPPHKLVPLVIITGIIYGVAAGFGIDLFWYLFGGFIE